MNRSQRYVTEVMFCNELRRSRIGIEERFRNLFCSYLRLRFPILIPSIGNAVGQSNVAGE